MQLRYLLLLCLFTPVAQVSAQDLLQSRHTSYFTYLFRLSDKEAHTLYLDGMTGIDERFFHTLVDSFPTDSGRYLKPLPVGHYLLAHVQDAALELELHSEDPLNIQLLNNKQDLSLMVHDALGHPVVDAQVFLKNRRIPFDPLTQRYQLRKTYKDGLLRVEHQGHSSYFQVKRKGRKSHLQRLPIYVVYYTPIRFVWLPIRAVIQSIRWRNPQGWVRWVVALFDPYYRNHRKNEAARPGYFVFSQPIYRPGDTVRFKAWITSPKGRPLRRSLNVVLNGSGYENPINKTLASLQPVSRGAYVFEFVLHDSLDLQLDRNFRLHLENARGDVLMLGRFRLEDYELEETSYAFRSESDQHSPGKPMALYVRGSDANDLNLLDAEIELYVFPKNIDRIAPDSLFLPDTLWTFRQRLDPVGETKILLPDSLFPRANLSYEVQAIFTNAANERHEEKRPLRYLNEAARLELSLDADTLAGDYLLRGKSRPLNGQLLAFSPAGDTLLQEPVALPLRAPANPYVYRYLLLADSLIASLQLNDKAPQLSCFAARTADSLFVQVENPRKLNFWYTLYRKNQRILEGQGDTLQLAMAVTRRQNYFVSLQYVWGGEIKEAEYKVGFADKQLNVALEHPTTIYPGQTADINLLVTDARGAPVPFADLTAWGLTSKFKTAAPPTVPDFSKTWPGRKLQHHFSKNEALPDPPQRRLDLDYPRWNALTGLDSIAWFQFLYPEGGLYRYAFPAKDSVTQFAPFIVQNGKSLDVHMIFLDEKLIWFSGATALTRYTFAASPGYHRIRLRTSEYTVQLDSVQLLPGQKLIFSVEAQPLNPHAGVYFTGRDLLPTEISMLSRMLMPVRHAAHATHMSLMQDGRYQLAQSMGTYDYSALVFGPFYPKAFQYADQTDSVKFTETFEPGFDYEFSPRRIKMRSVDMRERIDKRFVEQHQAPVLGDSLLTEAEIMAMWANSIATTERAYYYQHVYDEPQETKKGFGKLQVEIGRRDSLLHQLLFKAGDPEFIRIYPGWERLFHQLEAGEYLLVGLRSDSSFFRIRGLHVRVDGLNYYRETAPTIEPVSGFSIQLLQQVNDRIGTKKALETQKETIKSQYRPGLVTQIDPGDFTHLIFGRVIDEASGEPLPGATIVIMGTTSGAIADLDGYFQLYGPPDAMLRVSYIGYEPQEIPALGSGLMEIALSQAANSLEEVVVTGFGISSRMPRAESETALPSDYLALGKYYSLSGKVSGVLVDSPGGLVIRGARAEDVLYYIDGMAVRNMPNDLSPAQIASMEALQGEAATSLYGARAANGVVIITTLDFQEARQKQIASLSENALQPGDPGNSLRRNFRDNAFWQPNLLTGRDGRATFSVTFPDDVTKWKTFALAMGPRRQSGQTQGEIKAYKELMAQLAVPRFLVQGDTTQVIGKVLNYTPDTLSVSTSFQTGDAARQLRQSRVITALLDTLLLAAPTGDSLSVTYSMERENGYFDGEMRWIPLFPRGVEETQGQFLSLDRDTTLRLSFDPALTGLTIRAQASPLRVLLEEMERLRGYRYLCNEQVASKIKSMLLEARVRSLLGEELDITQDIQKLLDKLRKTQDSEGLWGWWANGAYNPWISRHVLEALLASEAAGYPASFNRQAAINELVYQLEKQGTTPAYRIESLFLLQKLGAKVDFSLHADSLSRDTTLSLIEQFHLLELRQTLSLPYALDSLNARQQETLFGNLYWGESGFHPYFNSYTPTLAAYRILRAQGGEEARLRKIRNYLFEQKRDGYWTNTYTASAILETILPEVMAESDSLRAPRLVLRGAVDAEITTFPFEAHISPGEALFLEKTGSTPVYFTAFQSQWNVAPGPVSGDFTVNSHFLADGDTLRALDAGKPVTLRVQVEVKKLSEFMMLEIPIPAGCSYAAKPPSRWRMPEVHREYFRDRVSIFCERLAPGIHTFDVELLPRFTGVYALNPARIEQMYFPVFFGRNGLERVKVE